MRPVKSSTVGRRRSRGIPSVDCGETRNTDMVTLSHRFSLGWVVIVPVTSSPDKSSKSTRKHKPQGRRTDRGTGWETRPDIEDWISNLWMVLFDLRDTPEILRVPYQGWESLNFLVDLSLSLYVSLWFVVVVREFPCVKKKVTRDQRGTQTHLYSRFSLHTTLFYHK